MRPGPKNKREGAIRVSKSFSFDPDTLTRLSKLCPGYGEVSAFVEGAVLERLAKWENAQSTVLRDDDHMCLEIISTGEDE
jgi:hypothetical protein